jgi:hypothetical protein
MGNQVQLRIIDFYENVGIITFINVVRLKWAGHVVLMDQQRPAKRILNAKTEGRRKRSRPKLRLEDGVSNDVKVLGITYLLTELSLS